MEPGRKHLSRSETLGVRRRAAPGLTLPSPQMGQYTSVFLDNASGSPITVRSGSHFSAVLLGV